MKILHVVHQYLPEYVGGTEFYTQSIAQGLAQRGHQVGVFYRRDGLSTGLDSRQADDGLQIWAVQAGPLSARRRFMASFREKTISEAFDQVLAQFQPELIHIQHLMGLPLDMVDHIRRRQIPFIITLHDYWWICANAQLLTNYSQQLCQGPQAYFNCGRCALARAGRPSLWPALPPLAAVLAWRNRRLRQILNEADILIAPTEFTANWYQQHGVSAERLRVMPHGLDISLAPLQRKRDKNSPFRFAFIGGLSWQKGVHILLEAFRGLNTDSELWLAGDEATDPSYVERLRSLASPQVRFLGKLDREAVWRLLSQVDVVVVPALWYESFSFIISEAFAAGLPVVASRLGSLADRVEDEVNGLLVPPGDSQALQQALLRICQEPDLWPRLQAGIRPVRTINDYLIQLEAIYQAALSS